MIVQGEEYSMMRLEGESPALTPALADCVTAHPVAQPDQLYRLHAYVSRVRGRARTRHTHSSMCPHYTQQHVSTLHTAACVHNILRYSHNRHMVMFLH